MPSENPASLKSKINIARMYNLKGIALWRLGLLSNDMWSSLEATAQAKKLFNNENSARD
ncbi:hypothetical protein N752_22560 [Desulforamulus aquiferis]|nr:hypothetical protein N752_22560 [Desulforamulus aquiferis]